LWARIAEKSAGRSARGRLGSSEIQLEPKKIMKTNDFYKIINGIESFFEKEAMILLSRK